jgi:hypothetical protein
MRLVAENIDAFSRNIKLVSFEVLSRFLDNPNSTEMVEKRKVIENSIKNKIVTDPKILTSALEKTGVYITEEYETLYFEGSNSSDTQGDFLIMLNQSRVLQYVKMNLAFPFQFIEYTDEQILEYLTTFTLREFSHYVPDVVTIGYNLDVASNRVPGKENEYYIQDEQGLEVLNVANIYFSGANMYMFGHPPFGPMNFGELRSWFLDVEVAGWVKQFSNWDYTWEFKSPNIVRISPTPVSEQWIAVEYERMQPPDLSKVPNDLQMLFCELCLADIMILLGRLRKKYSAGGGIPTPFGNVPLSDEVGEEGKEKKTALIEKFEARALPNITLDIG